MKKFCLAQNGSQSMCLVRSSNVGLDVMWMAAWLSKNNKIRVRKLTQRSLNNWHNQTSPLVVAANARYLASAHERETVDCFLALQEINESLR